MTRELAATRRAIADGRERGRASTPPAPADRAAHRATSIALEGVSAAEQEAAERVDPMCGAESPSGRGRVRQGAQRDRCRWLRAAAPSTSARSVRHFHGITCDSLQAVARPHLCDRLSDDAVRRRDVEGDDLLTEGERDWSFATCSRARLPRHPNERPVEDLRAARDLIAGPRLDAARVRRRCGCCCAVEAILTAAVRTRKSAFNHCPDSAARGSGRLADWDDVTAWNDHGERTHDEVLRRLRRGDCEGGTS